jgi:RNA polymerase sigma factor (TIGR02999 family)
VETAGDVTALLQAWRRGSPEAENELFALVLPDLRRIAHYLMNRERKGHSLQATELVDQIYLRLVKTKDRDWQNRQHFFAVAAKAMRRHLIDHARGRPRADFLSADAADLFLAAPNANIDLAIIVDGLLEQLAESHPEWCTLVELKFFLGFSDEEAAEAMGMKLRSMQRMWLEARKWLFEQMERRRAATGAG